MKVLVTGHKGFIGSHLYEKLVSIGHNVLGIDLKDGKDVMYCMPNEKFDYVFHMAALPSVQFSVESPFYTMRQNVLLTSMVLEWALKNEVKRVIFSSSAAASDIQSPYGLHKRMSEMECEMYSKIYNLDVLCLRYYNVYSENQKYGGAYSTVISAWMEMLRQGKPLRIDGDGEQTRDFIHVDDIVSANLFCMQDMKIDKTILSIGSGKSIKINTIKKYLDKLAKINWTHQPSRNGDIKHSTADISYIQSLGWEPEISFEEGLRRCFGHE